MISGIKGVIERKDGAQVKLLSNVLLLCAHACLCKRENGDRDWWRKYTRQHNKMFQTTERRKFPEQER